MEDRTFTAMHIVEVLDKCRRELAEDLQRGVITLREQQRGASTIAAIAEKLDVFYAYALYHKKGEEDGADAKAGA
jgi:hypothetical protein